MDTMALSAVMRMGPPPRSLAAEANDCFMVRVSCRPTEYKVAAQCDAPKGRLPSNLMLVDQCTMQWPTVSVRLSRPLRREISAKGPLTTKSPYKVST